MNRTLTYLLLFIFSFLGSSLLWAQEEEVETYSGSFEDALSDTYNNRDFVYEATIENTGSWERFKFWLRMKIRELFGLNNQEASDTIDLILNVFAFVIIILVIYFIVKAIMNKEGTWIFGASSDKKIIDYETVAQNIHKADFDQMIRDAVKAEDYRLAIRWYYLRLLKKMSDKNIIEWDPDKTNADYLYEIKQPTTQHQFAYVSYLFNYTWYGHFEVDQPLFEKSKTAYETLYRELS